MPFAFYVSTHMAVWNKPCLVWNLTRATTDAIPTSRKIRRRSAAKKTTPRGGTLQDAPFCMNSCSILFTTLTISHTSANFSNKLGSGEERLFYKCFTLFLFRFSFLPHIFLETTEKNGVWSHYFEIIYLNKKNWENRVSVNDFIEGSKSNQN